MPRELDRNEEAARVVLAATGKADELPRDLEAAWAAWSARIHACDERTMTLLKAAFEAGASAAGVASAASTLGKIGASKGGQARAAKLSKKRRGEIAKQAAKKRWGG